MLDLEQIIAGWKVHAEAAAIDKHPTVWVAYFGTPDQALADRIVSGPQERELALLGVLSVNEPKSIGNAIIFLGAPWTLVDQVTECAIIIDVHRTLHVTHFIDTEILLRSFSWQLGYGIADDGTLRFGVAMTEPQRWPELVLLQKSRANGKGESDFAHAYSSALAIGEALL